MPSAQELQHRIRFESREAVKRNDGEPDYGNTVGDFAPRFTVWAGLLYRQGGEGVVAARLEGRQPVVITVRASSDTRQIGNDWRAVNARTGQVFAIRENPRPFQDRNGREDRGWLQMLAESGVAA